VFVAQRISGWFENAKNPSLTLRVSFGLRTLSAWSTWAKREKRDVKAHASGFLWLFHAFETA
ncbi:MAG: hypothetical protein KDA83_05130, partial [Planctomycetales bacterium]|nr:hypothetical protein [Planctomycetales bacterium]